MSLKLLLKASTPNFFLREREVPNAPGHKRGTISIGISLCHGKFYTVWLLLRCLPTHLEDQLSNDVSYRFNCASAVVLWWRRRLPVRTFTYYISAAKFENSSICAKIHFNLTALGPRLVNSRFFSRKSMDLVKVEYRDYAIITGIFRGGGIFKEDGAISSYYVKYGLRRLCSILLGSGHTVLVALQDQRIR